MYQAYALSTASMALKIFIDQQRAIHSLSRISICHQQRWFGIQLSCLLCTHCCLFPQLPKMLLSNVASSALENCIQTEPRLLIPRQCWSVESKHVTANHLVPSTDTSVTCATLTLWCPLLPYGYSYKASCARKGYAVICNFWHLGTLTLRAAL